MEEHLFDTPPQIKLYSRSAVQLGTFLGSPIVAGYLIAENYKLLGEPGKITKVWIYAIASTVVIFAIFFLMPSLGQSANYLVPIIYSGIASSIVHHFQGKQINKHIESGGEMYSVWRAALVGLIGLAGSTIILIIILLLTNKEIFGIQIQ
jgi:hypothetical protein